MENNTEDIKEEINIILDKISEKGIKSLTENEKKFLDAYSTNEPIEKLKKIKFRGKEIVFKDDFGLFKFKYTGTMEYEDEIHYTGYMYIPDFNNIAKTKNDSKIELEGKIITPKNDDIIIAEFEKEVDDEIYNVYEFIEGMEFELDDFIEQILIVINNEFN